MNTHLAVSPRQLYLYHNGFLKKKYASYQAFGQCAHSLLLEGKEDFSFYSCDRRTTQGKSEYEALLEQHKFLLSRADYDAIYRMRDAFRQFVSIKDDAIVEQKLNWIDTDSGVPCIAVVDLIYDDGIYELKTVFNIESFREDLIKYRYFAQASFYVDAIKILTGKTLEFRWFIIEKKSPYRFFQLKADRKLIGQGRRWYKKMCAVYAHCVKNNIWSDEKTCI